MAYGRFRTNSMPWELREKYFICRIQFVLIIKGIHKAFEERPRDFKERKNGFRMILFCAQTAIMSRRHDGSHTPAVVEIDTYLALIRHLDNSAWDLWYRLFVHGGLELISLSVKWLEGLSFFIGLWPPAYTDVAIGMSVSLTKEVEDPELQVPRTMVYSVVFALVSGSVR
ncbi:hypothetical protein BU17DRAFT_68640 [Hysterangium stoloniferum]|nr:hypothetical protein BU17DRAFT_68640 [Hysterangium stoloniferum]